MKINHAQLRRIIKEVIDDGPPVRSPAQWNLKGPAIPPAPPARRMKSGGNKVVINRKYGVFALSRAGILLYEKLSDRTFDEFEVKRHDPFLIQVVEQLGTKANADEYTDLDIVNITGNKYKIDEYDGAEKVITPESIKWVVIR